MIMYQSAILLILIFLRHSSLATNYFSSERSWAKFLQQKTDVNGFGLFKSCKLSVYMHVGDTLTLPQNTQNLQFNIYQTQEIY